MIRMKQSLLSILIISLLLLMSCTGDDNSMVDNVVLGTWNNYSPDKSDSLVMTRVFTDDRYSYFSYAEGRAQDEYNKRHYYIEDNFLVFDAYTQTFRIDADTLWITNSGGDQITKYVRAK